MCSHANTPQLNEVAIHPLDPLTAAEMQSMKQIVGEAGYAGPNFRYSYVMLREPDHKTLDGWKAGDDVPREVGVLVLDKSTNVAREMVVDVPAHKVVHNRQLNPATDGWGPILDEDYVAAGTITKTDPGYIAALARRGITDLSIVRHLPLSAGVFGYEEEVGRRMIRVLSFLASENTHSMFAHPIDGIVAHVDLTSKRVIRLVDTGYNHVPMESGDYLDPELSGPMRTDMKPLRITQPEGASFTVKNHVLRWQNWQVRIGFNGREGLTLHDVSFADRPILHRAAISEMVVPYGEPQPTHEWQNYFDAGEYQFGRLANCLVLSCDCLGKIQYLDATVADDFGEPVLLPNAICIHEEDFGTLWKHTDVFTNKGTIELECKATGIVFSSGRPEGEYDFATEMAPRLGAPCHQHLFSARLDVAIDGNKCHVDELEVRRLPISPENPVGNAFKRVATRLQRESDAQREADNKLGRAWLIASSEKVNRLGRPMGYVLYPEGAPLLLAADDSSINKRAQYATKHLWVTQYARDEMWAAGYTPNQHPGHAGLPAYAKANRSVDGEDIVVWHTFGLTHFPRVEDWPIMPVDYAGFSFRPDGFFDRNPTLDVPEDPNGKEFSENCECACP
ncbi:Histamine oxidase [Phytophthora fragariae]|nr:Histamine oxidase [Phytophthora fragariae]KAE8888877.1 Histamine oxidase [Phytophthora fragariae]KAE8920458.1 Histamine oxidase [Phytophthora fragariae]KAE8967001.1 Histamine oxidase [Phytophthora fragariae]KAE9065074.1 Histamine oxidase [Phytophthora fragariae]